MHELGPGQRVRADERPAAGQCSRPGVPQLATLTPDSPLLVAMLGLLLAGSGSGFAGPSTNSTVLGAVSGERAGMGAALNDTHQQLGIALSVAGLGSLFAAGYRARLPEPLPGRLGDSVAASFGYTVHRPEFAAAVRFAFTGAQGIALCVAAGAAALGALVAVLALRGHQGA
ncbi:hypothetical protein [Sciscionella marina]|uniref:hypothetical protein n=1 Tax=Sciscionella marina TaxID=508770 RepID=UPI001F093E4E|nr:hypothetical protein [Sciscionella marina]